MGNILLKDSLTQIYHALHLSASAQQTKSDKDKNPNAEVYACKNFKPFLLLYSTAGMRTVDSTV